MDNYCWKVDWNWIELQIHALYEKSSWCVKVAKLMWRRELKLNWNE